MLCYFDSIPDVHVYPVFMLYLDIAQYIPRMMLNCLCYHWYHMQQRHLVPTTFRRVIGTKLRRLVDSKKIEKVNLPSLSQTIDSPLIISFSSESGLPVHLYNRVLGLDGQGWHDSNHMHVIVYPIDWTEILHVVNTSK